MSTTRIKQISGAVAGELKKSYITGISNSHVNFAPATNFWRRCRGDQDTLQGESPLPNLFTLFLSCFILFTTLFAALNQNTKKLVASFTLFAILIAISKTQKN